MNEWMNELNELPSSKFILIETKWNLCNHVFYSSAPWFLSSGILRKVFFLTSTEMRASKYQLSVRIQSKLEGTIIDWAFLRTMTRHFFILTQTPSLRNVKMFSMKRCSSNSTQSSYCCCNRLKSSLRIAKCWFFHVISCELKKIISNKRAVIFCVHLKVRNCWKTRKCFVSKNWKPFLWLCSFAESVFHRIEKFWSFLADQNPDQNNLEFWKFTIFSPEHGGQNNNFWSISNHSTSLW